LIDVSIEKYKLNSTFEEKIMIIESLHKFTKIISNEKNDPLFVKKIKEICNG
jgi:hypothetical protein